LRLSARRFSLYSSSLLEGWGRILTHLNVGFAEMAWEALTWPNVLKIEELLNSNPDTCVAGCRVTVPQAVTASPLDCTHNGGRPCGIDSFDNIR
jgi:hypothetical protein